MTFRREMTLSNSAFLLAAFAPASRVGRVAVGAALAASFAVLTALGAHIVIPLEPVPITMQTLFVLLAGASIGRGWGTVSQALYVTLGAAGLPVFAGGATGLGVLSGVTGGYLVGFLVTPWVVGALLPRSDRVAWQALVFLVGKLLILTLGVLHLALFFGYDLASALAVGALPFIPGAVFKIIAAVSIHRSATALVRHYRRSSPSRDPR
jgi:biotin transport system substrate-specific component